MYNEHIKNRFWSKVDRKGPDDCWNWTADTIKGYGRFSIDRKTYLAHRIAWELVNDSIPDGKLILHRCDNPSCCNPTHLYCGTQSDNMQDALTRKGTTSEKRGYRHARLYEGEIWLIRKIWKEGKGRISQKEIARMFKVGQATISHIVNKIWLCKEGYYVKP